MRKTMLGMGLVFWCLLGSSQTLIQPSQIRVTTNQFPMMASVGVTNLDQAIIWIAANWPGLTMATTNQLSGYTTTNAFQGVASNFTSVATAYVTNYGPTTNILRFVNGVLKP